MQSLGYLPPQVRGEVSSFLDLTIGVTWKTIKTFNQVRIKLLWWGESEGIFIEVNAKALSPIRYRYQICTTNSLWFTYLKHAGPYPLRIEIYSSKTLSLIGTSNIHFWSSTRSDWTQDIAIVSDVLTARHFKLGEISLNFALHPATAAVQMPFAKLQKADPLSKSTNKENLQIIGKTKKISLRGHQTKVQTSSYNPTARSKSAPLKSFNYEESRENLPSKNNSVGVQTLKQLQCGLPEVQCSNQKFITLDGFSTISDNAQPRKDLPFLMSLAILKVNLEPSEQQRIQQFMNNSPLKKFIFKCAVTSKKIPDDYCLSPVFVTVPQSKYKIYFLFKRPTGSLIIL